MANTGKPVLATAYFEMMEISSELVEVSTCSFKSGWCVSFDNCVSAVRQMSHEESNVALLG